MDTYKVTWLDNHGNKYTSTVKATNLTQAERAIWGEEEKCLSLLRSVKVVDSGDCNN